MNEVTPPTDIIYMRFYNGLAHTPNEITMTQRDWITFARLNYTHVGQECNLLVMTTDLPASF